MEPKDFPVNPEFKIGDLVDVDFQNSKYLKHVEVFSVRNYGNIAVFYDVKVPVGFEDDYVVIDNLESRLLIPAS